MTAMTGDLHACAACGHLVHPARPGSGLRCPACGWIDDYEQLVHPDLTYGANAGQSLRQVQARAREALDFMGISELADADATSLSYGQQRAVELARALAAEPELLLLDEPAAGLNMRETAELAKLVRRLRERGITVLIVEHDMGLVMNVSDEVVVLSYGEKIADAEPRIVQKDPEVIRIYLGEEEAA